MVSSREEAMHSHLSGEQDFSIMCLASITEALLHKSVALRFPYVARLLREHSVRWQKQIPTAKVLSIDFQHNRNYADESNQVHAG